MNGGLEFRVEGMPVQDPKITYEPVAGPVNDGNSLQERAQNVNLHKSLYAKLALSHYHAQSESDSSRASSPKARCSPVRKMFDPFVKAKSQRSLLNSTNEVGRETMIGIKTNKTLCEFLPRDFSEMPNDLERNYQCQEKENCSSVSQCSPAHLYGVLKLENKHGAPFFKFSVKSPEDVYVAKTWKSENSLTWVYTFYSLHRRRKSNASGWRLRNDNKESSMKDESFDRDQIVRKQSGLISARLVSHLRQTKLWTSKTLAPKILEEINRGLCLNWLPDFSHLIIHFCAQGTASKVIAPYRIKSGRRFPPGFKLSPCR
ncbi:Uncharacterized protein Fot_37185 [Forsythia ovata]|uniref:Uncharacterized protein n=1 Tax=Forsythia ovata TaxID=205694 RepID=A0ABD1SRK2_9LAMI